MQTKPKTARQTVTWRLKGPGDSEWSVWDFGDEMTVQDGPELTSNVVSRIPEGVAGRLTSADRRYQMENAAGAIHVARLLGSDSPNLRYPWRTL